MNNCYLRKVVPPKRRRIQKKLFKKPARARVRKRENRAFKKKNEPKRILHR